MKNKIFKYDFLVVGGGLIGSLAALSLYHKVSGQYHYRRLAQAFLGQ